MEWHDISAALSRMASPFPLAAVREARRRREELAPFFVAELERVADGDIAPIKALATATGRERGRGLLRSHEAGEKFQAAQRGRREISYAFLRQALGLDRAAQ